MPKLREKYPKSVRNVSQTYSKYVAKVSQKCPENDGKHDFGTLFEPLAGLGWFIGFSSGSLLCTHAASPSSRPWATAVPVGGGTQAGAMARRSQRILRVGSPSQARWEALRAALLGALLRNPLSVKIPMIQSRIQ